MNGIANPYALVHWSTEVACWQLLILTADDEPGLFHVTWPEWQVQDGPPTLLMRYDALAQLGYVVMAGGPDAWRPLHDDDGMPIPSATFTAVRLLGADELTAEPLPDPA
ncbi:DUF6303 family protein [Streptomyces sp. NPDC002835]